MNASLQGELHVRKSGDRLTFSNRGTDPQVGAINITLQPGAAHPIGDRPVLLLGHALRNRRPLRHMDFEPTPGAITTASYPASVANGEIGTEFSIRLPTIACQDRSHDAKSCAAPTPRTMDDAGGGDLFRRHGPAREPFMNIFLMATHPRGAYSFRDGLATAGVTGAEADGTECRARRVGHAHPYLHRREVANSGGPGAIRWRDVGLAFTAHKTDRIVHQIAACGVSHPTAMDWPALRRTAIDPQVPCSDGKCAFCHCGSARHDAAGRWI